MSKIATLFCIVLLPVMYWICVVNERKQIKNPINIIIMNNPEIEFVKSLLPSHYDIKESGSKKGSVHCVSAIGLRKLPYLNKSGRVISDDEDDDTFSRFVKSLKIHFGNRFQEVYHNTCFCHVDFTIYLRD